MYISNIFSDIDIYKGKIRLADLFMLGGLLYLMLATKRQATMFVLIGAFILNRLIMEIVKIYNSEEEIEKLTKGLSTIKGMLILSIIMLSLSYYMAKDKVKDQLCK